MEWSAERIPGKVSGQSPVKGTRIPIQALLDNSDDFPPEDIAAEIDDGLPVERAHRVIAFARLHAPHPV